MPSVVGSMLIAARYLRVLKQRDQNGLELKKLELEIAERNKIVREKELEQDAKRLEFEIQSLEQKKLS